VNRRTISLVAVCLGVLIAGGGCVSDSEVRSGDRSRGDADLYDVGVGGGGVGDALVDQDEGGDAVGGSGGGVSAVVVGVVATPALVGGVSGDVAEAEAVLMSFAAGARGLVVEVDWGDLLEDKTWVWLEGLASYLGRERKQLLLSIPVVDAYSDRRPQVVRGTGWMTVRSVELLRGLIDRVFERLGSDVTYLSLGMEVDLYLEGSSVGSGVVEYLVDGLEYAREHDGRSEKTGVGLTWSARSARLWSDGLEGGGRSELVGLSDVVMLVHHGMDEHGSAQTVSAAVAEVGGAVDAVVASVGKPVVLHRVAATTSSMLGGSEVGQAEVLRGLFGVVGARRESVPFVGVAMLHDPRPESCFGFATARVPGGPSVAAVGSSVGSSELYAFWCSAGIRDVRGVSKESFDEFVRGAALFLFP